MAAANVPGVEAGCAGAVATGANGNGNGDAMFCAYTDWLTPIAQMLKHTEAIKGSGRKCMGECIAAMG
ncbi:MAG: hypothetical protein AABZ45_11020 [Pseudomonadota bacterium]